VKKSLMSQESTEFQEFLSAPEIDPPKKLAEKIFSQVHRDLHPSQVAVLSKLALIHAGAGTLTLLSCPYSEIYLIQRFSPMNLLMGFGEQVCMLGCGAVFLGGSALVASLALRQEEVQVIRKAWIYQLPVVTMLSTGFFVLAGLLYLQGLFLFWALGSILGGFVTLELGWAFRKWIRSLHLGYFNS
jgi:hypothetical protein